MCENDQESEPTEPTQLTQPKQGEPVQIPVPKREDFERVLRRAAQVPPPKRPRQSE